MIRAATPADVPLLVALGADMHAESTYRSQPYLPEKVATFLSSLLSEGVVFVTERDGQVVGGVAGGVSPNWFNDELIGFEYALFVAAHARHGTTAMRLLLALSIWCQRRGAKRLRVGITTGVHVEATARLYRSLGFVDSGVFLTKEF